MKLFIFLLTATSILLQAQQVEVGVKGGFVFTDQLKFSTDNSRPYTIGGSVEIKLPANFAIEADRLYKRLRSDFRYTLQDGP